MHSWVYRLHRIALIGRLYPISVYLSCIILLAQKRALFSAPMASSFFRVQGSTLEFKQVFFSELQALLVSQQRPPVPSALTPLPQAWRLEAMADPGLPSVLTIHIHNGEKETHASENQDFDCKSHLPLRNPSKRRSLMATLSF